jgi:PAS domain S-box-containing protein
MEAERSQASGIKLTEEQKVPEEELRSVHQQLLDIIDFLPDATFVVDCDNKVIAWNKAIEAMTGVKAKEILGRGDYEYALPFYGIRKPILIDLALKPASDFDSSYYILEKDGKAIVAETYLPQFKPGGIYLWSKARALYDSRGNLAGAIESIRDITQHKKTEIALQESLHFLQHLIDTIPGSIFYKDISGIYQVCNSAFQQFLGLSKEEIIGKSVHDIFPEDLAGEFKQKDEALFKAPGIQIYESSLMYADGTRHDVVINKATYSDSNGNACGLVGIILDITNRKQAEEALRESEGKYRLLVENLNDVIYTIDAQGVLTYISSAVEQLCGYSPDEVIGQFFGRFIYPEDLPALLASFQRSMEGRIEPFEFRIVDKAGAVRYVRSSSRLLLKDNEKLGLSGVITDITERRRAEASLRDSREYLNQIINTIGDPIFVKDSEHRLVLVNDAECILAGRPREELLGKTDYDFFPREQVDVFWKQDDLVLESGQENANEETITDAEGNVRTIITKKTLHMDKDGGKFIVGVIRDITKRKHAEEELHKKDVLLNAVALATNILLTETDLKSAIKQTLELLGSASEVDRIRVFQNRQSDDGRHLATLYQEWRREGDRSCRDDHDLQDTAFYPAVDCWYEALSAGHLIKGPVSYFPESERRMLQSQNIISILAIPILIEGQFWGAVSFEDCHCERIWTGSNVHILHSSAASIGSAIARKHVENELRKAKDAAEAGALAKSQFMANMSHELRTPMNAVIGMTSLLLEEEITADQRDCIETIRSSGEDLMFLINSLLDFTKMNEQKVELESQAFELRRCIEDAMDLLAGEASRKDLKLSCRIDGKTPEMIIGDPTRLRQILGNLLNNAVKFTEKGSVTVTVHSLQIDEHHRIHFEIQDTGIGIAEDQMHNIFEPFCQADASITRKYGGTGLGLAISKRLVELMQGEIWAESETGKGSTFHFTILAKSTDQKALRKVKLQPEKDLVFPPGRPLRILLAEDNEVNQTVIQKMLKRLGFRADLAANGIEAVQALQRQPYDVVLMDVKMPELDGWEATRQIRRFLPDAEQPEIIAITAYALEGDRERCLAAGMDDYISKPVQMKELRKKLIKIAEERS